MNIEDVPEFKCTSFESGADIAKHFRLDFKQDEITGEITIGRTKIIPTGYDKNGSAIVSVRAVAEALGFRVRYDDKTKTINVTSKPLHKRLYAILRRRVRR